jgi:hypothetical protein
MINKETLLRIKNLSIDKWLTYSNQPTVGGKFTCPLCQSGTGKNKTSAFSVKNNRFRCFACNERGDIVDLVQSVHKVSFEGAVDILCNLSCTRKSYVRRNRTCKVEMIKVISGEAGIGPRGVPGMHGVEVIQAYPLSNLPPNSVNYLIDSHFKKIFGFNIVFYAVLCYIDVMKLWKTLNDKHELFVLYKILERGTFYERQAMYFSREREKRHTWNKLMAARLLRAKQVVKKRHFIDRYTQGWYDVVWSVIEYNKNK